jgi:hypothetical protein
MTVNRPGTEPLLWIGLAFGAGMITGGAGIGIRGANPHGISLALLLTARLSFVFFWLAYTGGSLARLFGARFAPLRRTAPLFGLSFAAAHLVHLGLVAWLCAMGDVPPLSAFILFGFAAFWTYLLAGLSFGGLIGSLPPRVWWVIRGVGMNVIMFAFAFDFLRYRLRGTLLHEIAYIPFVGLIGAGLALRAAALVSRSRV